MPERLQGLIHGQHDIVCKAEPIFVMLILLNIGLHNIRMLNQYPHVLKNIFIKKGVRIGSRINVKKGKNIYLGLLMPGHEECIVLKLDSGYNIGIKYGKGVKVEKYR